MKTLIRLICCVAVAVAFAGCHEEVIENENGVLTEDPSAGNAGGYLADGYFRATFFPQQGSTLTRAEDGTVITQPKGDELRGYSKAIQTLKCFVYQEQNNGEYLLIAEKDVIEYNQSTQNNVLWPLATEVSFDLPNGNYKAVFVGNASDKLFPPLKNKILTGVDEGDKFEDARLNMPETENGLAIFEDVDEGGKDIHNMLYLCTVDFNQDNFNGNKKPPYVLMQRVVSQHVYGRDFLDTNNSVNILVNNIVDSIVKGNLLKSTLEGILRNRLLTIVTNLVDGVVSDALTILTPLYAVANALKLVLGLGYALEAALDLFKNGITEPIVNLVSGIVDELVKYLLGPILDQLNQQLVGPLTNALNNTLTANSESLLGLHYLLNPWQHVNNVDIQYSSLTKSIGFDRTVKDYYTNTDNARFSAVSVVDGPVSLHATSDEKVRNVYVTTLSGIGQKNQSQHLLSEINVNNDKIDQDLLGILLGGLLDTVDDKLLNGLLINIHKDLEYDAQSNLQYETRCEFINLTLSNYEPDDSGEKVSIKLELGDVLQDDAVEELLTGLLGANGILGDLLKPITDLLDGISIALGPIIVAGNYLTGIDLDKLLKLIDNILAALIGDSEGNGGVVGELVESLSEGLDIYLPALNVNTIEINGSWDKTEVSNGEVISRP